MSTTATDSDLGPPQPESPGDFRAGRQGLRSRVRPFYWSVRREVWESRSLYLAPLIVAGLFLLAFLVGLARAPIAIGTAAPEVVRKLLVLPYYFGALALMAVYVLVAVLYSLEALHGERRDRSILFWKSLPVSDLTVVLSKVSIPMLVLPVIVFLITVALHICMLLLGGAVLLVRGIEASTVWSGVPLLSLWAVLLCHLLTVHALYPAPIYGWLLLVSASVRRAALLWAALPPLAIVLIERYLFGTYRFAALILKRFAGGPNAIPFPPEGGMMLHPVTLAALGRFFATPGLWIGLGVLAVFLAASTWVRRYQGPI